MGLLDGNLSPEDAGQLALIGGLLSPGSFGQGLSRGVAGQQAALTSAQNMAVQKQALEMQKLQYAAQLRNQNLINDALDGALHPDQSQAPQAPQQPSVMAGAGSLPPFMQNNPGLTPGATPPSPQASAQQSNPLFGNLPRNIAIPDLVMNGGKGLADLQMKYNSPVSFRPGGYALAPNGSLQQLPQVPEGFQAVRGADGQFKIVPVAGGPEAVAATSEAKASGPAGFHQTDVIGPGNVPYKAFNKELPGFKAPAAVSAAGEGDRLRILTAERAKPTNSPEDNASLDREIARLPASAAAAVGLPRGAVQTGLAPGTEEGAKNAQNVVKDSFKAVMAGAQPAATVQARLDEITKFSKGAILGGETQWRDFANNLLNIAGISDKATDRKSAGDLLDKNASQIALAIGTGTQGTDALRSLAAAANPSRHMTQGAIEEAVRQLQASAQVAQAKAQILTPKFTAATQNPAAAGDYNQTEQAFDKNADYRLWQLHNMSAADAQKYRQQIGEKAWGDLMSKAKNLKSMGVF